MTLRYFHKSHNTVQFGGLFALRQWISSSLKHDTVPRVNDLYCFYVKKPSKCIALWEWESSECVPSRNREKEPPERSLENRARLFKSRLTLIPD